MRYTQRLGDKVKVYKTTDIVGWAEKHGFKQTGVSTYKYNLALQGQPTFDGLHGPMWGGPIGDHHFRYEDDAFYKVSAEVIDDILRGEKEGKKESLSREFIKKVEK